MVLVLPMRGSGRSALEELKMRTMRAQLSWPPIALRHLARGFVEQPDFLSSSDPALGNQPYHPYHPHTFESLCLNISLHLSIPVLTGIHTLDIT